MKSPAPNSSVKIREATPNDRNKLHDIDIKCFDDAWDHEAWIHWFEEDRVVYIVELDNKEVGFAVCVLLSDGIFIERLGVKPAHRLKGISMSLLMTIQLRAGAQEWPGVVTTTVPEIFLSPGRPDDISGWVKRVGFKARPPLHPGYFCINGEDIDGVPCLLEE